MFPWKVSIQCLSRYKVFIPHLFVDNFPTFFRIEVNWIVGVLIWSQVCTNIRTWLSGHSGRISSLYNVHFWPERFQHNLICSLLILSETNILEKRQTFMEMCLYEVSYIIVQYRKWVPVVAKPAILLSEQFNWSHVIKTTNRKLGICWVVRPWSWVSTDPTEPAAAALLVRMRHTPASCYWVCSAWLYRVQGL